MTFSELTGRPHSDVRRGDVAVCVCAIDGAEQPTEILESVRADTIPVPRLFRAGGAATTASVSDVEEVLLAAAPADVALLADGCQVTGGWLDALRAAASSDARVAMVSALGAPAGAAEGELDSLAAQLAAAGARRHPDAPIPSRDCLLIRRAALELVGPLDRSLPLAPSLVDFTQRCLAHGLRHVIANDVLVSGGPSSGPIPVDETLAHRYPYLRAWCEELDTDQGAPLSMLSGANPAERLPSVTVDGRCLGTSVTGTAVAVLDLVEGLRARAGLRVRVLVLDRFDDAIRERLAGLGVELLAESDAGAAEATDIAHRPYQLGAARDLLLLRRLGRRVIVTQLDSIAYRTPTYFDSHETWRDYRALTQIALASADEVVFLSAHGAADAAALGLVDAERSTVISLPVTARPVRAAAVSDRAEQPRESFQDAPYLLCLGTDFAHKNRPFALRLLEALLAAERFEGRLVFAGPHVGVGSSASEEAAYLERRPDLAERVIDLGAVDEARKRRLLGGAAAIVYPTTFEGFGLIPFEAANLSVPALFAWVTSLRDLFPEELALLVPWDAQASARAVAPVLSGGEARERQVQGVLAAGAALTDVDYARRHAELYARALARTGARTGRIGVAAAEMADGYLQAREDFRAVHRALDAIYQDPIAAGFVGPHAIVPEELQRAALALTRRPALRDAAVALYRLVRRRRAG